MSLHACPFPSLDQRPSRLLVAFVVVGCFTAILGHAHSEEPTKTVVYASGEAGYHTYRIPAIVVTKQGTLLAFCEGRKSGRGDHGDLDLLVKHSIDNGKSWSRQQIVHEEGGDRKITIGNPCPVVDQTTGVVWLSFCRDNDDVFMTHSADDGQTWASPQEITAAAKDPDWTWYATGPVNGIQLRRGPHRGRLVMPCDHRVGTGGSNQWKHKGRSHVIYSDDHGKSWQRGKPTGFAMNECTIVELADGKLMLNMRSYRGRNHRAVALSADGGVSWSECRDDPALIEPVCQASILRYRWPDDGGKSLILFSNPASKERERLTIRLSDDEARTWAVSKVLSAGPSAYSCLVSLPDGSIGCLYETGQKNAYETIVFARFSLAWLTGDVSSGP